MDYLRRFVAYLHQFTGKAVKITTLYVKPLSGEDQGQELRRDDILNHFSAFGDVASVHLHNKSNQSYGFVKFTQPESAAKALQTEIHTIAGCKVEIDSVHAPHQDCVSLLDLNDDCLLGIFAEKSLSVEDLCSVAETCRLLKEIAADDVFRRQYKKCNLLVPETMECSRRKEVANARRDGVVAKRILVNFGSVMSELDITGFEYSKRTDILDYVARYCGNSLGSLTLVDFNIPASFAVKLQPIFKNLQKCKVTYCTFEGASKELFAECPEMVELIILGGDMTFMTEKTLPKLKHFEYQSWHWSAQEINLKSFLSRHQNLQVLNIRRCKIGSSLLQSIADNCTQLEQLQFDMPKDSTFDLSNFVRLRKLKICFASSRATRPPPLGWNNLHFLVDIKLELLKIDSEFVRSLSQLKGLQVLELVDCSEIQNLQQIGDMNQLTKLKFSGSNKAYILDWASLIQRLGNLKFLHLCIWDFDNFDVRTSSRIVEAVRRRSQKSKLHFRIVSICGCRQVKWHDVFYQNEHLVEMLIVCQLCSLK